MLIAGTSLSAMPNFARKYNVDCAVCHTTIPRLNGVGLDFRKAGFRNPEEIGKDVKTKFVDTLAARIQMRYDYKDRKDAGKSTVTNQLTFHEVTLYPLSAAFGPNLGSLMELSIANEDFVEIENAYLRYVAGRSDAWFSARLGIFHPFEGYGASDRPYSISRPFLQTNAANHNGSTLFTPWGFDQSGLDVAYAFKQTSISATVFNGLVVKNDEGAFKAFPAAGGELQKAKGFRNTNAKDFQLTLTRALKDDGSGLTLYYYNGAIDLPIPGTAPDDFGAATSWSDPFYRFAAYANYRVHPKVDLQAAYQWGQDHFYDPVRRSKAGTFKSRGYFGEVDADLNAHLTVGARYDWFDPSDRKAGNEKRGFTLFANAPMNNGVQAIAEYQHVQQKRGTAPDLKDDNFQIRFIWIF